jgi:hypothetical protein
MGYPFYIKVLWGSRSTVILVSDLQKICVCTSYTPLLLSNPRFEPDLDEGRYRGQTGRARGETARAVSPQGKLPGCTWSDPADPTALEYLLRRHTFKLGTIKSAQGCILTYNRQVFRPSWPNRSRISFAQAHFQTRYYQISTLYMCTICRWSDPAGPTAPEYLLRRRTFKLGSIKSTHFNTMHRWYDQVLPS